MHKTGTGPYRAMTAAMMLLAVFFVLPVSAQAMPAGSRCHQMSTMADAGNNHARVDSLHHCCDHQPGQSCPDDMNCSGASMNQCAAGLAFLQAGAAALLPLPRDVLAPPPNETAASFQDRLNAPPPRG